MSANSKTGGAPIFYCPICPMLPGWLLVQARDAHMEDRHPEQPKVTGSGLGEWPTWRHVRAAEADRDQLRAELAAANAEAERLKAAHAIVPDEVEHTFRELRTEYAELRENIDGWTKQCRTLEPLVANRDGESIIGAAAKEIEQLRAENAKWLKLLQARTLEKERISDENERLTNENIDLRLRLNDRILRGDTEAK